MRTLFKLALLGVAIVGGQDATGGDSGARAAVAAPPEDDETAPTATTETTDTTSTPSGGSTSPPATDPAPPLESGNPADPEGEGSEEPSEAGPARLSQWEIASADWQFDYANKGKDWENVPIPDSLPQDIENMCGKLENQSPVNLLRPLGSYGWAYGVIKSSSYDKAEFRYENVHSTGGIQSGWLSKHLHIELPPDERTFFRSDFTKTMYNDTNTLFKPTHMIIQFPAEHPINGEYYSFELQIHHDAVEEAKVFRKAVISVFFSESEFTVENSKGLNLTVHDFFDNFKPEANHLTQKITEIDEILLDDVMKHVDLSYRWTYHGTDTQPPCHDGVYWNILQDVLPVDDQIVERFKYKLSHHESELKAPNNVRNIYSMNKHEIQFVGALRLGSLAWAAAILFFAW